MIAQGSSSQGMYSMKMGEDLSYGLWWNDGCVDSAAFVFNMFEAGKSHLHSLTLLLIGQIYWLVQVFCYYFTLGLEFHHSSSK
jgi:hypothetical protein